MRRSKVRSFPYRGRQAKGASASRLGPWDFERTFEGLTIVSNTSGITQFEVSLLVQSNTDPGSYVPQYMTMPVVMTEDANPIYRYTVAMPSPLMLLPGESVFIILPLVSYVPLSYLSGDCYDETRTWWYGLPIAPDGTPSWATLLTPEDRSVDSYQYDFAYGLISKLP